MESQKHVFANEWANQTTVHPLGVAAVVALGAVLLLVRRRYATWPMIVLACFVCQAQRVVVAGLDFDFLRILTLVGTVRVLSRQEYVGLRWGRLDTAVVCWAIASAALPILRVGAAMIVNRLGLLYDVLGMYFLLRCLLRGPDDVSGMIKGLALVSVPVAAFILVESSTRYNVFSVFGGVPAVTQIRDGRLRCQGAFSHPILAGSFWAAVLPLLASQWWCGRRAWAVLSSGAALFIVLACASATPVLGVMATAVGGAAFFIRGRLRWVRWGIVVTLIALHLVMKQPVWHLIARMSSLGGSSWHRFALVDGAITHANEWWLMGTNGGTGHWGHYTFDVTNYYIVQAITGGLIQLASFIALIAVAFSRVGAAVRRGDDDPRGRYLTWAVGVSLLVHAVCLFGVSYFGQVWLAWYLTLAAVGAVGAAAPGRPAAYPVAANGGAAGRAATSSPLRPRPYPPAPTSPPAASNAL